MPIPRVFFKLILTIFMILYIFAASMLTLENYNYMNIVSAEVNNRATVICSNILIDTGFGTCPEGTNNQYLIQNGGVCKVTDQCYNPVESNYEGIVLYNFVDMMYYMVVTMTTVGYGDICPSF